MALAADSRQPLSPAGMPEASLALQKSPTAVAVSGPAPRQSTLNTYLVEHSEFTPNAGMNGMMSYVRIVGYGNSKAQNDAK